MGRDVLAVMIPRRYIFLQQTIGDGNWALQYQLLPETCARLLTCENCAANVLNDKLVQINHYAEDERTPSPPTYR